MSELPNLKTDRLDYIVSVLRAGSGAIPIVGSAVSEIFSLIPKQRIDRLAEYILILEEKLSNLPGEIVEKFRNNPEFIDLMEEGLIQASRATSDERRNYIASVVVNGLNNEEILLLESKYLLMVMKDLSDIEIILLRSFHNDDKLADFKSKHKRIIYPGFNDEAATTSQRNKEIAFNGSYESHLRSLLLVQHRNAGVGYNDFVTELSQFGSLFLRQIGLID